MSSSQLRSNLGNANLDTALGDGPFYVAEVHPALYTTCGGLCVDSNSRVLGGQSFAGLYAAGEVVAKGFPELYSCSGVPLLHCITSGRKAAKQVVLAIKGSTDERKSLKKLFMRAVAGIEAPAAPAPEEKDNLMDLTKDQLIEKLKELKAKGPPPVAAAAPSGGGGGGGAITMDEVKKHNKKEDAWIILNGNAIDVTTWIPIHPGGEPAIMGMLGEDASNEWNAIHKPGTVELKSKVENGPKILGPVSGAAAGGGGGGKNKDCAICGYTAPPDPEKPESNRDHCTSPIGAFYYLIKAIAIILLKTLFFTHNYVFVITGERNGTIRSAIFLLIFTIVHAGGNAFDVFIGGPREVNGETYFFDRMHLASVDAGIVEMYLGMALCLHVSVALKRTWDISMDYSMFSGRWNMILSGLCTLVFLIQHLQDFRFYPTWDQTIIHPPVLFVNPLGALQGHLWTNIEGGEAVVVRDVYTREWKVFSDPSRAAYYVISVFIFMSHMMWGWEKVHGADALAIPDDQKKGVKLIGWAMAMCVGFLYMAIPIYVHFSPYIPVDHNVTAS